MVEQSSNLIAPPPQAERRTVTRYQWYVTLTATAGFALVSMDGTPIDNGVFVVEGTRNPESGLVRLRDVPTSFILSPLLRERADPRLQLQLPEEAQDQLWFSATLVRTLVGGATLPLDPSPSKTGIPQ